MRGALAGVAEHLAAQQVLGGCTAAAGRAHAAARRGWDSASEAASSGVAGAAGRASAALLVSTGLTPRALPQATIGALLLPTGLLLLALALRVLLAAARAALRAAGDEPGDGSPLAAPARSAEVLAALALLAKVRPPLHAETVVAVAPAGARGDADVFPAYVSEAEAASQVLRQELQQAREEAAAAAAVLAEARAKREEDGAALFKLADECEAAKAAVAESAAEARAARSEAASLHEVLAASRLLPEAEGEGGEGGDEEEDGRGVGTAERQQLEQQLAAAKAAAAEAQARAEARQAGQAEQLEAARAEAAASKAEAASSAAELQVAKVEASDLRIETATFVAAAKARKAEAAEHKAAAAAAQAEAAAAAVLAAELEAARQLRARAEAKSAALAEQLLAATAATEGARAEAAEHEAKARTATAAATAAADQNSADSSEAVAVAASLQAELSSTLSALAEAESQLVVLRREQVASAAVATIAATAATTATAATAATTAVAEPESAPTVSAGGALSVVTTSPPATPSRVVPNDGHTYASRAKGSHRPSTPASTASKIASAVRARREGGGTTLDFDAAAGSSPRQLVVLVHAAVGTRDVAVVGRMSPYVELVALPSEADRLKGARTKAASGEGSSPAWDASHGHVLTATLGPGDKTARLAVKNSGLVMDSIVGVTMLTLADCAPTPTRVALALSFGGVLHCTVACGRPVEIEAAVEAMHKAATAAPPRATTRTEMLGAPTS